VGNPLYHCSRRKGVTWRLRFYDEDGVEIGYVEMPDRETYNVVITHPDSGWGSFEDWLETLERVHEPVDDVGPYHGPGSWIDHGPQRVRFEPEKHLTRVKEELEENSKVDSTTLADKPTHK